MNNRILLLQLRPEDATSDSEYLAILNYGGLHEDEVHRLRIEKHGMPVLDLDHYCAVIVGGSPFDISTPQSNGPDSRWGSPPASPVFATGWSCSRASPDQESGPSPSYATPGWPQQLG